MLKRPRVEFMEFAHDHPSGPSVCGVAIDHTPQRPLIHLFEVRENEGGPRYVSELLPHVAALAMDTYLPGQTLDKADFAYTAPPFHSRFNFMARPGGVYVSQFSSLQMGGSSHMSRDGYERALSSDNFEKHLTGGHPFYQGEGGTIVTLPAPQSESGVYFMKQDGAGHHLQLVDTEALRDLWLKQSMREEGVHTPDALVTRYNENAKVMSGDDNPVAPFGTDVATARHHLAHARFDPAPDTALVVLGERLSFINGRHRTMNLMTVGAPVVPFTVSHPPNPLWRWQMRPQGASDTRALDARLRSMKTTSRYG